MDLLFQPEYQYQCTSPCNLNELSSFPLSNIEQLKVFESNLQADEQYKQKMV